MPRLNMGSTVASGRRALRVLIAVENMSYTYDTRVRNIARTLADVGHRVCVLCPRDAGDPSRRVDGNITVYFFPLPGFPGGVIGHLLEYAYCSVAITFGSLLVYCRTRFDVIHICNPPDIFFPLGCFFRLLGRHFIFDLHDLCPELWQVQYAKWPAVHRLLLLTERLSLRSANHVLVTSETARRSVCNRAKLDPARVSLVSNGPDLTRFLKPTYQVRSKARVREIGYVGEMNAQDCLDLLLLAARHIRRDLGRGDIRFVLIGDGNARDELRNMAERLGLTEEVQFTGRLSPVDAMKRLESCSLCVQPDRKNPFNDSCVMVKSLEYMALGKAFVAFDLIETQRVCGDAALYATDNSYQKLAELLVKLADDAGLRRRLGERGRSRIEQELAWSFSRPRLLRVYRGAGNERKDAARPEHSVAVAHRQPIHTGEEE